MKVLDYNDNVFYKIASKNPLITDCYIGQTTNLDLKKIRHQSECKNQNNPHFNDYLYEFIRNNGGMKEWLIVKVEAFPCNDKHEANKRLLELIKEHNANLNSVSAFVTEDERKATKQACTQKYREENKELGLCKLDIKQPYAYICLYDRLLDVEIMVKEEYHYDEDHDQKMQRAYVQVKVALKAQKIYEDYIKNLSKIYLL